MLHITQEQGVTDDAPVALTDATFKGEVADPTLRVLVDFLDRSGLFRDLDFESAQAHMEAIALCRGRRSKPDMSVEYPQNLHS